MKRGFADAGGGPRVRGAAGEASAALLRYLALGDSYTIGEGVAAAERWPVQLAEALRADRVPTAEPQLVAQTGWTTGDLAAALDAAAPEGPFGLVTLLIGVNNQYRGRSLEAYRAEFRALLARAAGYAGDRTERVVVVSIPDWGVTPFAGACDRDTIGLQIDAFNAVARREATARGISVVDVTAISRAMPEAVVADGLHPSGAQYAAWVKALLPAVRHVLGGR